jgi:hypothetical protein
MYRHDQFRRELLLERCRDLVSLEERIAELDTLIAAAVSRGRTPPAAHCECGAAVFWGARFCAHCGRPVEPR